MCASPRVTSVKFHKGIRPICQTLGIPGSDKMAGAARTFSDTRQRKELLSELTMLLMIQTMVDDNDSFVT